MTRTVNISRETLLISAAALDMQFADFPGPVATTVIALASLLRTMAAGEEAYTFHASANLDSIEMDVERGYLAPMPVAE